MEDEPGGTRLGDPEREALAQELGRQFAEDRLDPDELDRRLGVIYGAATREEAARALAGLPPLPHPARRRRRRRRHGEAEAPGPTWVPTSERFVDPPSGRVMRVWVDPAAGARHYVPER